MTKSDTVLLFLAFDAENVIEQLTLKEKYI